MADQVQFRGGTAAENDAFTGVNKEITVDTTNKQLRVHDGAKQGGFPQLGERQFKLVDSYAALESLAPDANEQVYVRGRSADTDGGQGLFLWIEGNQTALVDADPGAWEIVPPSTDTTGASGVWKRQTHEVLTTERTVTVPGDYATLQDAVDAQSRWPVGQGGKIIVLIQTGHSPASGILVTNGDYGHIWIDSEDATVTLDATFPSTSIIEGNNAVLPTLDCLIDADGKGVNGYFADNASKGFVTSGSGINNCAEQGCYANGASFIKADGASFQNASQGAASFSGVLSWGSVVSARQMNVSGSGAYGAQAAAGGTLDFREGNANNATTYGVRATNSAIVNARLSTANDCGAAGYRAFDNSNINASGSSATGSAVDAYIAAHGSTLIVNTATFNGAITARNASKIWASDVTTTDGRVRAFDGGEVVIQDSTINRPSNTAVLLTNGSRITATGCSFEGGSAVDLVNLNLSCAFVAFNSTFTADASTASMFSVQYGSTLDLRNGTYTYSNNAVNSVTGSRTTLENTGIPASDIPGLTNNTVAGRGILWGAA